MVQLRATLEELVMEAWKERWTEVEWGVRLRHALRLLARPRLPNHRHNSAEIANGGHAEPSERQLDELCYYLIRQATLSDVPNQLMFCYLSYTMSSQVVSHSSVLKAVVQYKDFQHDQCIAMILSLLNVALEKLQCNGDDAFVCGRFCHCLAELIHWILDAMASCFRLRQAALLQQLLNTALNYLRNPFVCLCLHFNVLEEESAAWKTHVLEKVTEFVAMENDWMCEASKTDLANLACKLERLEQVVERLKKRLIEAHEVHNSAGRGAVHPAATTMASIAAGFRTVDSLGSVADSLAALRRVLRLPWPLLLRDFMRAAFLNQLDPSIHCLESTAAAFAYLKLPRLLNWLYRHDQLAKVDVFSALEQLVLYSPLFRTLDLRNRTNSFNMFVEELRKAELVDKEDVEKLLHVRNEDRSTGESEASPSQSGSNMALVFKAETTVCTLEKSFNSEMVSKPEKLTLIISHMISGSARSFDFICAASSATGKILWFVEKLLEFNNSALKPKVDGEEMAAANIRAALFDVTFILLSRIRVYYHDLEMPRLGGAGNGVVSFYSQWDGVVNGRGNRSGGMTPAESGAWSADSHSSISDDSNFVSSYDDAIVNAHVKSLLDGEAFSPCGCDWSKIILMIPQIGKALISAVKSKRLADDNLKAALAAFHSVACSPLLCLAHWVASCADACAERDFLANGLLKHFHDVEKATPSEQKHFKERWSFMAATVRPQLEAALAKERYVCANRYYGPLIQSARRELVPVFSSPSSCSVGSNTNASIVSSCCEAIRQAFGHSLRQGWASPLVLAALDRSSPPKIFCKIWTEELLQVANADEMSLAAELCLGAAMIRPRSYAVCMARVLVDYCLDANHELFCMAPRGLVLARLVAQLIAVADQYQRHSTEADGTGDVANEPARAYVPKKCRKLESSDTTSSAAAPMTAALELLKEIFKKFMDVACHGRRPSLYFVSSFLRSLAELEGAERMRRLLQPDLLMHVIRTDPKIISASTVLTLLDQHGEEGRKKALVLICLLRRQRQL